MPAVRRTSVGTLAILVAAVALTACQGAASPSPSSSPGASGPPSASPSASPSPSAVGAIDHKTGPTDVVLRMEQGGGMVIDFVATQAPMFTLYGDGVIVFQRKVDLFPEADAEGVVHGIPWRTAKLDEDQVQELLEFAITQGALGTARDVYMGNIADAPSTIFTLNTGSASKVVTVNGLSELADPGPDAIARAAFFKLFTRLGDFDRGGTIDSDVYEPAAYRGILMERDANGVVPRAWPWPTIKLTDFVDPNAAAGGIRLPHRTMTPDEITALGIKDFSGGLQNVVVKGPDGKTYGFLLRPLLADEKE